MRWNKATLIGVGLLGGSLGLALKRRRLADKVTGFVRREASIAESKQAGAVDEATLDLSEAVADADLVVLCTPLAQMRHLTKEFAPSLQENTIVTDVGSVKNGLVKDLEKLVSPFGAAFIGSHPMAGAERMGVSAARDDLFQDAVCVVTPTPRSDSAALKKISRLWKEVGCRVLEMPAETHDELVARSSHLPHVLAAQLVNLVLDPELPAEQRSLCANGFRDSTRIAAGSPEMWRDIALGNRENLSTALDELMRGLGEFRKILRSGDERRLAQFFELAKKRRDDWSRGGSRASPE